MRQYLTLALLATALFSVAQSDSTALQEKVVRSYPIVIDRSPIIETDRPGFAESPNVVPEDAWQFETGFMIETNAISGPWMQPGQAPDGLKERNTTYNTGLIKYGVNGKLELRFSYAYRERGTVRGSEYEMLNRSYSPFYLGTKVNLYNNEFVSIGFLSHVYFMGETNYFTGERTNYLSPEFFAPVSFSITDDLSLGVQLGMSWLDSYPSPTGMYVFTVAYDVINDLGAFVQAYGYSTERIGSAYSDHRFNGGLLYRLNTKCQFDLSGGFGLTESAPDKFINVGFSYLFAK